MPPPTRRRSRLRRALSSGVAAMLGLAGATALPPFPAFTQPRPLLQPCARHLRPWRASLQASLERPLVRPSSPNFSSGPTKKRPGYDLSRLSTASLGRSHRSSYCVSRLKYAIDLTKELLQVPEDYMVGILPGGDTGAYEAAMWNLLGDRPVRAITFDAFGEGWYEDLVTQLRLDPHPGVRRVSSERYGLLPELSHESDEDVCFVWNGTTSGACLPEDGSWIDRGRKGLTLCDATSAAFCVHLPWDRLDCTTFSWQKALGGEGAHGMVVLSPRAVQRLETAQPPRTRAIPKVMRLVDTRGRVAKGVFEGSTINTPSMLVVEDYVDALEWVKAQGGVEAMRRRSRESLSVLERFVGANSHWISFLAPDPATRSSTSVCLELPGLSSKEVSRLAGLLEEEGVAYDIKSYRDAPAGLRIWCGATVEPDDVQALTAWIRWGYEVIQEERKTS